MKKPSSVNIMGNAYKILYVVPEKLRYGRMKMDFNTMLTGNYGLGECEWPTRTIRLNKQLKGDMLSTTLLHEIKHGQQFELGLTQVLNGHSMEIDADSFVSLIVSLKAQKIL